MFRLQREPQTSCAKEIMSTPIEVIDTEEPLYESLEMRNKGIRRLAVIEEGNLVGILTERRAR